jgi:hypothetical protein
MPENKRHKIDKEDQMKTEEKDGPGAISFRRKAEIHTEYGYLQQECKGIETLVQFAFIGHEGIPEKRRQGGVYPSEKCRMRMYLQPVLIVKSVKRKDGKDPENKAQQGDEKKVEQGEKYSSFNYTLSFHNFFD